MVQILAKHVGAVASLLLLVSCATTVRPPANVVEPTTVHLLTHGISSSLVLNDARYAYGDWRYYALRQTGVYETVAAVLWPTPAALGRQIVQREADLEYDEVYRIVVERAAVTKLRSRLDALFTGAIHTRVYNPVARLEFVRHPEPYSLFRNSNMMVARWLRELGAEVSGFPLLSKWKIDTHVASAVGGGNDDEKTDVPDSPSRCRLRDGTATDGAHDRGATAAATADHQLAGGSAGESQFPGSRWKRRSAQ